MLNILDKNWKILVLLALLVVVIFGRTIWYDYVQLDEGILLVNNQFFISDISNIFEVFKHDISYPSNIAPYYRPIFVLSFMLNGQFSSTPMAYHIGNVLLHIIAVFFVFWLFRELGHNSRVSFFVSAIFAVHPAVVPVVAWVPGRIEAILVIFTLLSFVMFIRFLKTGNGYFLASFFLSFIAALLTKEVVLGLIPVLFIYYLMFRKEKGSEALVTLSAGLAAIITVWFFIRQAILAGAQVADMPILRILSIFWSNSVALLLYLGKTVLPFNLNVFPILENSTLYYGFIVLVVLIVFSWKGSGTFFATKKVPDPLFGIVWFAVFLAPSLIGFYPTERMIFFEHRMYLPLIGILLFFASIYSNLEFRILNFEIGRRVMVTLTAVIILLFSVLAFNYSGYYKDRMTFWQKAVADSPQASQAHSGLASAYLNEGKIEEALNEFNHSLEINPNEKRAHLLLGLYYIEQGQYETAKEELEKEIEIDPSQFIAIHGIGRLYAQKGDYDKAEEYFLKVLEINSEFILAYQDLAILYFAQNKHPQAVTYIKELLKRQTAESFHPQIVKILQIYAEEKAQELNF